jgi:hypothetical protein
MSEEVEKRAGALTHEIPSNIPTQFDFGHTDAPVNYHRKNRRAQRLFFTSFPKMNQIFEHVRL